MKRPQWHDLKTLDVPRRPIIHNHEAEDVVARAADVEDFARGEGLRDEDAHFELEVEALRRGEGWLVVFGGLDYAPGTADGGVGDF